MVNGAGRGSSEVERRCEDERIGDFRLRKEKHNRGRSAEHDKERCACERERLMANRENYCPLPYVAWEPLTDTATTLYEEEVTGNRRLPDTKEEWGGKYCGSPSKDSHDVYVE